jgi:D-alanyl-D-alanine carboxypeptidase
MKEIFITILTSISLYFTGTKAEIPYTDQKESRVVNTQEIVSEIVEEDTDPLKAYVYTAVAGWWTYPEDIKVTTRHGNDLLVLVNKEYKLPSTYAPSDLASLSSTGIINGSSYYLRSILISDLTELVNASKAEGLSLSVVSAYRSYSTQVTTYNYWVSYNGGSTDAADKISARPGHSQHQLGTAIDFSSTEVNNKLGVLFNDTLASKWLAANGYKYGFVISYPSGYESLTGYSYESWHYRYIGKTYAKEMHDSGMILETYLRSKN